MDSKEARELRNLEPRSGSDNAIYKRRRELQRIKADLSEDTRRVKQIRDQTGDIDKHVAQLEDAEAEVSSEIDDQRAEYERGKRKLGIYSAGIVNFSGLRMIKKRRPKCCFVQKH